MNKYIATPLTAAIATALYPSTQALAQDQEQEDGMESMLEEVLVTATRRGAVSLQDVPQSLQAFDTEEIIRKNFMSFGDVSRAIPSLAVVAEQPGRNSVKFRGVSTGTQEFYTDSLVSIYLDETPLTFNSQQLWPMMVDVERIESLPGPQGTLFGSSSSGGTLRIVTNKPDPTAMYGDVFGNFYSTDGGDGSYQINGFVNIPLIKDSLALRIVLHNETQGGWIDNVYSDTPITPDPTRFQSPSNNGPLVENDFHEYELTGYRVQLGWNINDNWNTILQVFGEEGNDSGSWGIDTQLPSDQVMMFHKEFRDDKWYNVSLLIEGDLDFATLTSSTTYLDREIVYEWDNMLYEQYKDSFWGVYYGFARYNSAYTYGYIFNDQTQDRVSQELRLTSNDTDSRWNWMVGGFYEDVHDEWFYGAANDDLTRTDQPGELWYYTNYVLCYYSATYGFPCPVPDNNIGYSDRLDRDNEQLAFFGEVGFEITEKWNATFGARWFEFNRDYKSQIFFPEYWPAGAYSTNGIVTSESTDSDSIFKFSTQYFWDDDKMVYFLFSQGFRLGGENSQRAYNADPIGPDNPNGIPLVYEPEVMDNFELGVKTQWMDSRLTLNVTAFLMQWDDTHYSFGGVDGQWWLRGWVNGGKSEIPGVELFSTWQVTDGLRLEATMTFLDPETVDPVTLPDGDFIPGGTRLPNSSENSYYFAIDYTFQKPVFGGSLWTRVDYAYNSWWWNSLGNSIEKDPAGYIPSYHSANFQVGMSFEKWELTAYVNNFTDETNINGRSDNRYATEWLGIDDRFSFTEYRSRPRYWGVTARFRF